MATRPCYNEQTKTDCPDRCAGCSAHCDRWAEYVAARDTEYTRRFRASVGDQTYKDLKSNRIYKIRKAQDRLKNRFGRHSGG